MDFGVRQLSSINTLNLGLFHEQVKGEGAQGQGMVAETLSCLSKVFNSCKAPPCTSLDQSICRIAPRLLVTCLKPPPKM